MNLKNHILIIEENIQKKENNYLKNIGEEYINYIKKINLLNKASSKDFYIIISYKLNSREKTDLNELIENDLKEKYFKIKECLSRCGNDVSEIFNSKDIIKLFYSFLNTRKNIKNNF